MSGSSYNYKYQEIETLADMMYSPSDSDFGSDKYQPIRNRMARALHEIAKQCHDIEWIDSCDYGHEDWPPISAWLKKHNF